VCSGIEAASVAWNPIGWKAAWFSEIEPFPCAVLAHHYPDVPNLGDMTTIAARVRSGEVEAPELLCGGTPCQAFSVAGLREGLADPRGGLTLAFVDIANAIDEAREREFWMTPASSFGKTSPEYCHRKTTRSVAFLLRLPERTCRSSRQGAGGRTQVLCLDPSGQSPGESSTPNISAWPNAAVECSLSQVLDRTSIPAQFYLSEKACDGIVRRLTRKGK
jgi:hypothetical protein